jgi:hypothetical protein
MRVLAALLFGWTITLGASARSAQDWGPIEVAGESVAPGQTARIFLDIAKTIGGRSRTLDALVVVSRGARPGPTLCIIGGIGAISIARSRAIRRAASPRASRTPCTRA